MYCPKITICTGNSEKAVKEGFFKIVPLHKPSKSSISQVVLSSDVHDFVVPAVRIMAQAGESARPLLFYSTGLWNNQVPRRVPGSFVYWFCCTRRIQITARRDTNNNTASPLSRNPAHVRPASEIEYINAAMKTERTGESRYVLLSG